MGRARRKARSALAMKLKVYTSRDWRKETDEDKITGETACHVSAKKGMRNVVKDRFPSGIVMT